MSSLKGHARITRKAVALLASEANPVYRALPAGSVANNVVARDLYDVASLGHWADFGQCHHFMRRFDGQSEREAYAEAIHWIWKNANDAARILARQIRESRTPRMGPHGMPMTVNLIGSSQPLGNALHAVQDSFAEGHAEREAPSRHVVVAGLEVRRPGAIRRIKRYAGAEKDGHEEADAAWSGGRDGFSDVGWMAIGATHGLLRMIADAAMMSSGSQISLPGYEGYRQTWLAMSNDLSAERDRAFDLIDRFYTGMRLGARNLKTVSMDEEGLARALYVEAGRDMALVHRVFVRLDEHYQSDADDIAELYVNHVRRSRGPIEAALRGNPRTGAPAHQGPRRRLDLERRAGVHRLPEGPALGTVYS
jgi:hypothetical protein